MKSVLMLLLAVLLLGVMGVAGYTLYKERQPAPALPASATQAPEASGPGAVRPEEVPEGSTTNPAVLEKLLYEISKNADTVGWLQVPGTDIDSSVVQYHNNSYYLRRDERKKDSIYGCTFADYECSVADRENLTPNVVLYGHSDLKDNPDGPKFSQLFRFADQQFSQEHRSVFLSTPEETMEWEIFAAFYTDTSFNYIQVHNTPEVQKEIIDKALSLSVYGFGVQPSGDDKILTLSTCSVRDGNDGNHRFVVMARLKK